MPVRPDYPVLSVDISVEGRVTAYAGEESPRKIEIDVDGEILSDTLIEENFEATKFLRGFPPETPMLELMKVKAAQMIEENGTCITPVYGKDFFVVLLNPWGNPAVLTKIFVFNHLTREQQIFDADKGTYIRGTSFAQLHQNVLFYSSDQITRELQRLDSTITVFNLLTGQVEQTYPNQSPNGLIVRLYGNEDYLVYSVAELSAPYQLWCIDRHTHTQTFILSTDYAPTQFFFSGPLLLVNDLSILYQGIVVYDCSKSVLIKRVLYPRECAKGIITFEEGKLTIADPSNKTPNQCNVYIEDFENLHQPVNPEANTVCKELRAAKLIP